MTKSRYAPTRRALLIVNGLTNLTAAGLLLAKSPPAWCWAVCSA